MYDTEAEHRVPVTSPSEESAPPQARRPCPAGGLGQQEWPGEQGVPVAIQTLMISEGLEIGPFIAIALGINLPLEYFPLF